MATISSLVVSLSADSAKLKQDLDKANSQSKKWAKDQKSTIESVKGAFISLKGAVATLAGALSARAFMKAADSYTDLNSRVAMIAGSTDKTTASMKRLASIAARTYTDIGQVTEAYLGNARTLGDMGLSADTAMNYSEALSNALVVSGAKADTAARLQQVLADSMIQGKLSGDGLNTVMTRGGRIAELLAESLGTTVSGLKQMGADGKITSEVILKSLLGNFEKLREEADEMPSTFSDAGVQISNAFTAIAGRFNEIIGASSTFTGSIKNVTDALTEWAYSDGFLSIVSNLGDIIGGITEFIQAAYTLSPSLTMLTAAVGGLSVAFTVLGASVFWITGIAAAVSGLVLLFQNWETVTNKVKDALAWLFSGTREEVDSFFASVGEGFSQFGSYIGQYIEPMKDALLSLVQVVKTLLADAFRVLASSIKTTFTVFSELWNAVKALFSLDFATFGQSMMNAFTAVKDHFTKIFTTSIGALVTYTKDMFIWAFRSASDAFYNTLMAVADGFVNGIIRGLNQISIELPFGGGTFGFNIAEKTGLAERRNTAGARPSFPELGQGASSSGSPTGIDLSGLPSRNSLERTLADTATLLEGLNDPLAGLVTTAGGGVSGKGSGGSGKAQKQAKEKAEKEAKEVSDTFLDTLKSSFKDLLSGKSSFKEFFLGILDGFADRVLTSFTDGFLDGILGGIDFDGFFKNLGNHINEGLKGISASLQGLGGGSGGSLFGSIFGAIGGFFGFSKGGMVPHTPYSSSHRDSVPALLQPGEYVIPKSQVDALSDGSALAGGNQTINLSITGDISRQTRSEIMKMIPQIAASVRLENKEMGFA